MSLDLYRRKILERFGLKDVISYSIGKFDSNDWEGLEGDVRMWWKLYKDWERDDSVAAAFKEQRLTVKGTSALNSPIEAQDQAAWGSTRKFEKPKPPTSKVAARFAQSLPPEYYPIKKTNESIVERLDPKVFVPEGRGESRKTELGLHDLSAGLMNPKKPISEQQYKTPSRFQTFVFMPLADAGDQAVFQNINTLAKAYREKRPEFYKMVRDIRSRMTRIKLAAEHDMATNFIYVGNTSTGRPKFKFDLLGTTDVSLHDRDRGVVPKETDFGGKKVIQMETTQGIREARQRAALNYQHLVLGEMLRYGEVVVAYRQHDGKFPKFAKFDGEKNIWKVESWGANHKVDGPPETFLDLPT